MGDQGDRFSTIRSELDAILADDGPLDAVATRILQALCQGLGWDVGIVWKADESPKVMRCVGSWHDPSRSLTEVERLSARSTFSPGVGLPGRVLSTGEPWWIRDVQNDRGFPRRVAAMEDGIHSALGVPLMQGRKVVGCIELLSFEPRTTDLELLVWMASIGEPVGRSLLDVHQA